MADQVREYWYMGSMLARSVMEKNSTDEWMAMGLYPRRAVSIFFSVCSAMACGKDILLLNVARLGIMIRN